MIAVDTTSNLPRLRCRTVCSLSVIWVVALIGVMVPISEASADAERIQYAMAYGEDGQVTAELQNDPVPGHTLVAISAHRYDWAEAELLNDGWREVFVHTEYLGENDHRRGLAMWSRHVGVDDPRQIEVEWSEGGSGRDVALLVQEFDGNFREDVHAFGSTGTTERDWAVTDWTDESTGALSSLGVGALMARGDTDSLANWWGWPTFLMDPVWLNTVDDLGSEDSVITIQSAYETHPDPEEWFVYAQWFDWIWDGNDLLYRGNEVEATAAISVFAETELNFDDECRAEIVHDTGDDYSDDECVFEVPDEGWGDGAENPDTLRVYLDGADGWERVSHIDDVGELQQNDECDGGALCHRGYCRDTTWNYACRTDADCEYHGSDYWCHPHLGCTDATGSEYCREDGECDDEYFCWYGRCYSNDYHCEDHDDCLEDSDDEACHEGLCRKVDGDDELEDDDELDGWCPSDEINNGGLSCADDFDQKADDYCQDFGGCIDAGVADDHDDNWCEETRDCDDPDSEFCWEGACIDENDRCEFSGGWEFVEDSGGSQIRFTDDYCGRINDPDDIREVEVQRACRCEFELQDRGVQEGDGCTSFNPQSGNASAACQSQHAGEIQCQDGYVICNTDEDPDLDEDGTGGDDCELSCEQVFVDEDAACTPGCDSEYIWTPDGEVFCEGDEVAVIEEGDGRCDSNVITADESENVGEFKCPDHPQGQQQDPDQVCLVDDEIAPELRPMPEICNGLDSSCDGAADNIESTWIDFLRQDGMWDHTDPDNEHWTEEDNTEFEEELKPELEEQLGLDLDDHDEENLLKVPARLDEWDALEEINPAAACFGEDMCVSRECDTSHTDPYYGIDPDMDLTIKKELTLHLESHASFEGCQCTPN